jgi:hypothetical protein
MSTIRDATPADAEAACKVMRQSIAELCEADHHDDQKILAAWLANKQPRTCFLASTATARRFCLANGYVETGRPAAQFGTSSGFPMSKTLK